MPKYLMIIVEDQSAYQNPESATMNDVMQQHGDFAAAVEAAGAKMLGGEALQPTSTATYLRGTRSGNVTVVDNPAPVWSPAACPALRPQGLRKYCSLTRPRR